MSGNYPAGVTDNDPYFDMPSGDDEVFEPAFVLRGGNSWQKDKPAEVANVSHDPDCKCDECECPY